MTLVSRNICISIIRWVMEFITGGTHLDLSKIIYDIIQIQIGVGKIIFTVHN